MRRGRGGMRGRGRYNGAPHKNERSATKIKDKAIPRMSPRGETFKKELLSKIVPWEEIPVSLSNFPYYIDQHPKDLLMECVASYLKQTKLRNFLGRLKSSSERILLRSILGTELYLERLVSALARELQVPFLKFARELEVPSLSLRLHDDEDDDDCDNDYYHEELVSAYERDDAFPKFKRGDRVIYYNEEATISVDGLNNRTLSSGQRGEVYEVDGDRVAVVFNICGLKTKEAEKDVNSTERTRQALVTWVNVRKLMQDDNARTHDCYIAMEALYEVLASQQPLIVYFPDSHFGLSDSLHHIHEEFLTKMRKIFNQLPEGVVMICADHWEATSEEMKYFPQSLKNYVGCLESPRRYHQLKDICKIFTNDVCINPPTDQDLLNKFIKQIEEDRFTIISEGNLNIMHKFLKDRNLSCIDLEHANFEDVILTRQRVEKIVGWASNHYLSSCDLSCVNQENLHIPLESIKLALLRLKEEEPQSKNHSYYYEENDDDDDGDDDDDEQVQLLQKMPCKKAQSSYNSSVVEVEERRMSVAEMNLVMNRLGMEGINENSSVGSGGGGAEGVFEEEEPSLDEIKETFRVFDANNDGFIDGSDLHRIISNLGFKEMYDLEDYKRMIKAFDGDGDGLIDFPDFIKLMEKCLC